MPLVQVAAGEIALVVATDGAAMPAQRVLGREIACDHFQDRRSSDQRGERGRQLGI